METKHSIFCLTVLKGMCSLPACRDYWYPTLCERAELWGWRRWSDVCGAVWEWGLISFPPPRLLVKLLPKAAGGHSLVEQSSCLIHVCAARVARRVVRHWNLDVVPGRWLLVALLGQHGLLGPSLPQPFSATVKYSFCINISDNLPCCPVCPLSLYKISGTTPAKETTSTGIYSGRPRVPVLGS